MTTIHIHDSEGSDETLSTSSIFKMRASESFHISNQDVYEIGSNISVPKLDQNVVGLVMGVNCSVVDRGIFVDSMIISEQNEENIRLSVATNDEGGQRIVKGDWLANIVFVPTVPGVTCNHLKAPQKDQYFQLNCDDSEEENTGKRVTWSLSTTVLE